MKLPPKVKEMFRKAGARGGNTRAEKLTAEQRKQSASRAAQALTREQRSAAAKKAWATKRKKGKQK